MKLTIHFRFTLVELACGYCYNHWEFGNLRGRSLAVPSTADSSQRLNRPASASFLTNKRGHSFWQYNNT